MGLRLVESKIWLTRLVLAIPFLASPGSLAQESESVEGKILVGRVASEPGETLLVSKISKRRMRTTSSLGGEELFDIKGTVEEKEVYERTVLELRDGRPSKVRVRARSAERKRESEGEPKEDVVHPLSGKSLIVERDGEGVLGITGEGAALDGDDEIELRASLGYLVRSEGSLGNK